MASGLCDNAASERDNGVGGADGREAMRDDEGGAAAPHGVEGALHDTLRGGIQRRRRLVEKQQPRLPYQRARDGNALLLTTA